jgi:hypothetical protein
MPKQQLISEQIEISRVQEGERRMREKLLITTARASTEVAFNSHGSRKWLGWIWSCVFFVCEHEMISVMNG